MLEVRTEITHTLYLKHNSKLTVIFPDKGKSMYCIIHEIKIYTFWYSENVVFFCVQSPNINLLLCSQNKQVAEVTEALSELVS